MTPLSRLLAAGCALAGALCTSAGAQEFVVSSTEGLPGSEGVVIRLGHPAGWQPVIVDDPMAIVEWRGHEGPLTAILQVGRGPRRDDIAGLCRPERARTMLREVAGAEADARVTDVFYRPQQGRPGFEVRYQRSDTRNLLRVRSVVVCLKDTRLVVSCGALASMKAPLAEIEPVCQRVLESLDISED